MHRKRLMMTAMKFYRDIFKMRPQEIGKIRVLLTFVDSRQVYEAVPPGPQGRATFFGDL
jgi:hypothetical protein